MNLRQAAQQALEALERYRVETPLGHQPHMIAEQADIAITALKQALAEHEPLGWITAGQHTAPLRTHWEGCEAVHPECKTEHEVKDLSNYEFKTYKIGGFQLEAGFYSADELRDLVKAFDKMNAVAERSMRRKK